MWVEGFDVYVGCSYDECFGWCVGFDLEGELVDFGIDEVEIDFIFD